MKEKKYGLIILCGFLLYTFLPLRAGKRAGQEVTLFLSLSMAFGTMGL